MRYLWWKAAPLPTKPGGRNAIPPPPYPPSPKATSGLKIPSLRLLGLQEKVEQDKGAERDGGLLFAVDDGEALKGGIEVEAMKTKKERAP